MPAFAVNWGKYPALVALATIPTVIAVLILWLRMDNKRLITFIWGGTFLLGVALMHTRIIICVLLIGVCWILMTRLHIDEKFGLFESVRYSLFYIISVWPLVGVLVDYYNEISVLIVLIILMPF